MTKNLSNAYGSLRDRVRFIHNKNGEIEDMYCFDLDWDAIIFDSLFKTNIPNSIYKLNKYQNVKEASLTGFMLNKLQFENFSDRYLLDKDFINFVETKLAVMALDFNESCEKEGIDQNSIKTMVDALFEDSQSIIDGAVNSARERKNGNLDPYAQRGKI